MGSRSVVPVIVLVALAALFAMSYAASARQRAENRPQITTSPALPLPPPPPPPPAPKPRVRGIHRMAVLHGSVPLRARPNGPVLARAGARTEFGGTRVLSVAARRGPWLGVTATEVPNGQLAWVNRKNSA